MRTGTSDILSQGQSRRLRLDARLRRARKSRNYRMDLEGLESRTLLATIPAAAPTSAAPTNLSTLMGNAGGVNASMSSSVVAVDPLDPSKLVAVWIDNDPTMFADTDDEVESVLEAAYSTNAGAQWNVLLAEPINGSGFNSAPILADPATSGLTVPYAYVSSPSLGFDDSGNFYILSEYSNLGAISGAITLQKFDFTATVPSQDTFSSNKQTPGPVFAGNDLKVIYQWVSSTASDQALDPTMTVDDNLSTIPAGVASQPDPNSGNIYVSWASVDLNAANPFVPFNPNRIKVEVSSDGGNNFSPMAIAGADNTGLPVDEGERDASPALESARAERRLRAAYQETWGSRRPGRGHL